MQHYILYGHGGSGNHGCEAIVRTTAELLDYKQNKITLVSRRAKEDYIYNVNQLCQVVQNGYKVSKPRRNADFWKAYYELKIKGNYLPMDELCSLQALNAKSGEVALSIGGDAYCYG